MNLNCHFITIKCTSDRSKSLAKIIKKILQIHQTATTCRVYLIRLLFVDSFMMLLVLHYSGRRDKARTCGEFDSRELGWNIYSSQ